MHPYVLIERHSDHRHPTRSDVPRHSHEAQRGRSVDAVRVDNVHVAGDEDADGAKTKHG